MCGIFSWEEMMCSLLSFGLSYDLIFIVSMKLPLLVKKAVSKKLKLIANNGASDSVKSVKQIFRQGDHINYCV